MADLVRQRGKFLGGLHPGKQRDFSAVGQTLGGSDLVGVIQRDPVGFHELDQPFAVAADIALHFGQSWKVFALRLAPIKNVDGPESVQRPLTLRGASSLGSSVATSFVLRLPTIGARMKMPFSPRLTKRPSEFHVRSPATLVASGFCRAMSMMLPKL